MQVAQLKTTRLGQTGLEIARVGSGAWAIGSGGREFRWGLQEYQESIDSIDSIHRVLELGATWLDTTAAS
jgi:aryl-alcohol dehydrogenase-like predicted oxidoreductase